MGCSGVFSARCQHADSRHAAQTRTHSARECSERTTRVPSTQVLYAVQRACRAFKVLHYGRERSKRATWGARRFAAAPSCCAEASSPIVRRPVRGGIKWPR
eukprot:3833897-Alexandrium_andersonii.AAC.1